MKECVFLNNVLKFWHLILRKYGDFTIKQHKFENLKIVCVQFVKVQNTLKGEPIEQMQLLFGNVTGLGVCFNEG